MGEKGLASATPFIIKRLRGAVEGSVSTWAVNIIIVHTEAMRQISRISSRFHGATL